MVRSENIRADALAFWNKKTQKWQLTGDVFPNYTCADCDGECSSIEITI